MQTVLPESECWQGPQADLFGDLFWRLFVETNEKQPRNFLPLAGAAVLGGVVVVYIPSFAIGQLRRDARSNGYDVVLPGD